MIVGVMLMHNKFISSRVRSLPVQQLPIREMSKGTDVHARAKMGTTRVAVPVYFVCMPVHII